MSRSNVNRRVFLQSAAATAVTPCFLTSVLSRAAESAAKNDRPHVGLIGAGGRGRGDMKDAAKFGEVVAVCDADRLQAERAKQDMGGKPDICTDYRRLLDRKDIDEAVDRHGGWPGAFASEATSPAGP